MISEILGGVGLGLNIFGAIQGTKRDKYAEQLAKASDEALLRADEQENMVRRTQMNLDAIRRKRDILRNAQVASASSTAKAYGQGAGMSSFASGAQGSISGAAVTQTAGIQQNLDLGEMIFNIEDDRIRAHKAANEAKRRQGEREARQEGFNKIVGAITGNLDKFQSLGENVGAWGSGAFTSMLG